MFATLTPGGWVFMIASFGAVIGLVVFCYRRILRQPGADEPDPPEHRGR